MIALQGYEEVVVWDPYESPDDGMSVKLDVVMMGSVLAPVNYLAMRSLMTTTSFL